MAICLFTFVDLYSRALATTSHLLAKGAAYADEHGIPEAQMLDWRLIDDMNPLRFQVSIVCNFAVRWPARAAGLELPAEVDQQLTVAGFQKAIAARRAILETLNETQFEGRDDVPVTFQIAPGMEPTLPAGQWLSVFATTNLHFHVSITYAILRNKGVPLGKPDMFATGL